MEIRALDQFIGENSYGHQKRLHWLLAHIKKEGRLVELGCGTGYMITRPLARLGYQIIGVDLDEPSIEYGQKILASEGLDTGLLQAINVADLDFRPDGIIASEVLEHIPTPQLHQMLDLLRTKLAPGGLLLVTVPNGYGWFELESFLWFKMRLGSLVEGLRLGRLIRLVKQTLFGATDYPYLSTVADSPHVQRFTYGRIQRLLEEHQFEVQNSTGSVLFAGPFSNLFFTGIKPLMQLNNRLGSAFPRVAAGFYLACRVKPALRE